MIKVKNYKASHSKTINNKYKYSKPKRGYIYILNLILYIYPTLLQYRILAAQRWHSFMLHFSFCDVTNVFSCSGLQAGQFNMQTLLLRSRYNRWFNLAEICKTFPKKMSSGWEHKCCSYSHMASSLTCVCEWHCELYSQTMFMF